MTGRGCVCCPVRRIGAAKLGGAACTSLAEPVPVCDVGGANVMLTGSANVCDVTAAWTVRLLQLSAL